jgi:ketosteroid isomerase-like protein
MRSPIELFNDLDRRDSDAWAAHLAPDVVMRFANEDPVYGRDACRAAAVSLFVSMESITHYVIDSWVHGDATIVEASVEFVRPDGVALAVPMVTIYRTAAHGLVTDYRVYVDPSELWPSGEKPER